MPTANVIARNVPKRNSLGLLYMRFAAWLSSPTLFSPDFVMQMSLSMHLSSTYRNVSRRNKSVNGQQANHLICSLEHFDFVPSVNNKHRAPSL